MAAAGLLYIGMLPFSVRSYRRLKREAEGERRKPTPRSPPARSAAATNRSSQWIV